MTGGIPRAWLTCGAVPNRSRQDADGTWIFIGSSLRREGSRAAVPWRRSLLRDERTSRRWRATDKAGWTRVDRGSSDSGGEASVARGDDTAGRSCFAFMGPRPRRHVVLRCGPVKDGTKGFEYAFGSGKVLSCRYEAKDFTRVVNQNVMSDASQVKGWTSLIAGKTEALAGDPDGAVRQTDQGDDTSPNLRCVPGRVIVELRLMGVGKTNPGFEARSRPLDEIAAEAGFFDQAHLGRLFRRRFGVTPAAYRRRVASA